MKKRAYILLLCGSMLGILNGYSQEAPRMKQPDLQTTEFFDPTKEKEKTPYQFSTDWRIEAGYAQWEERVLDTTSVYQHGLRVGATVDFNLPHHFSVQTGALATLTYGLNAQHWRSLDEENVQAELLDHNIVQLQLTIPVRAYYTITLWKELRMFFFAGPQLQIGLTNYDIINNKTSALTTARLEQNNIHTTSYDRYVAKEIYRANIQFGLGGGFEWDRYRLQAGYDFGLNNLQRSSLVPNQKMHQWGWMVTFAYKL
jgi:outer membrane receptor protein involved in Fe transport